MLDNNNPQHRKAIAEALTAAGIENFEYHSGGGMFHIVHTLYEEGDECVLWIATGEDRSPDCVVALMGYSETSQQGGMETPCLTVPEVVAAFQKIIVGKDAVLTKYHAGGFAV